MIANNFNECLKKAFVSFISQNFSELSEIVQVELTFAGFAMHKTTC